MTHFDFQRLVTETASKYQIREKDIYDYLARVLNTPVFPQSFERYSTGSTKEICTIKQH